MKALALVDAPDHVCCRYRVRAFEPAMSAAGWTLTIEGLARGVVARTTQLRKASGFDAVILQRKLLPAWQLGILRRRARRLLFDFDDAVFLRDSYDPRGPRSRRRSTRFARTVRAADGVIAGNGALARWAIRAGAKPDGLRPIPTCVDPARYPLARPDRSRTGLDLVWIGSSSTLRGIEAHGPFWGRLAREVPGVRLRVIADRTPDLGPLPVVGVAWTEATEAAELAAGEVGVAWVPDDPWSRGKCGLKVLQYMAAGLPVVANPVGVHAEMVEPGRSGFLASSDDGWIAAIRILAADPELRARMGREARVSIAARYDVATWSPAFVAALAGSTPPPAPKFGGASTRSSRKSAPDGLLI